MNKIIIKDVENRTTNELLFRLNLVNFAIKLLKEDTSGDVRIPPTIRKLKAQRRALLEVINERTGGGPPEDSEPIKVLAQPAVVGAKGQDLIGDNNG